MTFSDYEWHTTLESARAHKTGNQLLWETFEGASELDFFLPKISDLLDWTVKNPGRLDSMLPLVFRELSRALFSVSPES